MRSNHVLCLLGAFAAAPQAFAQSTPPDYGFTWSTIGDPGNVAAQPSQFPTLGIPRGSVDHAYRMTTTEITVSQYCDFLNALSAAVPTLGHGSDVTGTYIDWNGTAGHYTFTPTPLAANSGADMGWNYAAMYCNWLCNGKGTTAAAFLNGAYNVSTFYPNPGPAQVTHTPGAQFWLPSLDEWIKAMFFDPNKGGASQPGYWLFPTSSDTPPVGGPPGTPGAQTGVGSFADNNNPARIYPVGSYPDARSPWGLLDGSGGVSEWCEGENFEDERNARGSKNFPYDPAYYDRIDTSLGYPYFLHGAGIRLASAAPTPGSSVLMIAALGLQGLRRHR